MGILSGEITLSFSFAFLYCGGQLFSKEFATSATEVKEGMKSVPFCKKYRNNMEVIPYTLKLLYMLMLNV